MSRYQDLEIDQGADASIDILLKEPITRNVRDLTGITPSAKMMLNYADDTGVAFSAIVSGDPTRGIINLSLTDEQTTALTTRWKYVYDLELAYVDSDLGAVVEKAVRGTVKVNPGVNI